MPKDTKSPSRKISSRSQKSWLELEETSQTPQDLKILWKEVPTLQFGSASIGFLVLMFLLATDDGSSGILYLLHNVNLVFHEFGHPAFSFFGRTMTILGGTLGQLLIPAIVIVAFFRQRDTLGVAVGAFWFFENFLDIAVYMADARVLLLPLIGGGGEESHDWRNLFGQWGLLQWDTRIAGFTQALGWMGMIATWGWLGYHWMNRNKL